MLHELKVEIDTQSQTLELHIPIFRRTAAKVSRRLTACFFAVIASSIFGRIQRVHFFHFQFLDFWDI
jgi:hypothetical protein